ncbi:MAG: MBL fold metallo-hydrolase, partial [Dehalococcoidia bacterium]
DLEIVAAGPVGFGNNIYIVIDRSTGEAAFIDAPDSERSAETARAAGVEPSKIFLTHSHGDHTAGIAGLKSAFGCMVYADAAEPWLTDEQRDVAVATGDDVTVGNLAFRVVSNPGHTPGSTSFVHGLHAFVGDTLFPGGPGRTQSHQLLQQEIASIVTQLHTLPDETVIYPGHGGRTTIEASKAEYAAFAARDHDPDLHGDVLWLES